MPLPLPPRSLAFASILLLLTLFPGVSAAETNRFNLSEKPAKPRFPVTEKKWPANVGEADICLWHDDRLAALSLGVDDNFPSEIEWWKEKSAAHDFKLTWWVITGRILTEGRSPNGGLWSQYQELKDLGHAVESHTVTHLHLDEPDWGTPAWSWEKALAAKKSRVTPPAEEEPAKSEAAPSGLEKATLPPPTPEIIAGIDWEYRQSLADIEAHMPGNKVSSLAYPGGKNAKYNDRNLAAKHYRAARGTTGAPNTANQIDYMSTNAMSRWNFDSTRGDNPYNVLDRNRYRGLYYRGWVILFAHGVSANPELFDRTFQFIGENRENLWIGLYTDVAKYGQERDTATLKVESPGLDQIRFQLTDEMDNQYFNYPLTVKVRVPNDWKEVAATQAGKSLPTRILEHEGGAFALVPAVPDAGVVTLTSAR